jgi:uncharacterized membrane protein YedE/YeeE
LAIFVSMLGFALLAQLEWVIPNPNPMRLLSAVVGGLVFGVGMVLAGGCVTGSLYKAGEGRLNSILAVVGIGIGANLVGYGLLSPVKRTLVMATRGVRPPAGIDGVAGLAFPVTAAIIGVLGIGVMLVLVFRGRSGGTEGSGFTVRRVLTGAWPVALGGFLIGILGWLAYLSSASVGRNYPLGGTHGVMAAFSYLVGGHKSGSAWLMISVAGMVLGSALSAVMRRQWSLRSADASTLIIALFGGILVGIGAVLGHGCFTGNIISGVGLLSLHSMVFMVFVVLANWVTTILYLRGTR